MMFARCVCDRVAVLCVFLIEMWQLRVRAVLDDEGEEDELLPVAPWV
jgi:hypothetical protein